MQVTINVVKLTGIEVIKLINKLIDVTITYAETINTYKRKDCINI